MWHNWSGYVVSPAAQVLTPSTDAELTDVLHQAARTGQSIRVAGGGHSFSPLVATDGIILSLDRLQGVIEIDAHRRTARVRAGTRLWALGAALADRGFAMENLGDINVQSI
jgi:FAD/FMN-containing dehydrogenase